jgi:hypothetical protein
MAGQLAKSGKNGFEDDLGKRLGGGGEKEEGTSYCEGGLCREIHGQYKS